MSDNIDEAESEEMVDEPNKINSPITQDQNDENISLNEPKEAAQVFGDELADLSDSESEKSPSNNKEVEKKSASAAAVETGSDDDEEEKEEAEDGDEEEGKDDENETEGGGGDAIDDEEQEEVESEQLLDIQIPKVKTDLGKEVHFVKLPNFLSVEPRPFDHETYEDETPKGDALDEEGKTRVRLKVENTIRWKSEKDGDGNMTKQSNARMVKWSDGSMSLYLGAEIFDVYKTQTQGDHNHLFVRQGNVLHGQTVFKTKLTFRPYSTESLTHRKMTMSLVEHGSKTKKVKILNELAKNPENKRQELLKQEEEKLKAASRRQNQQRRMREKSHSKGLSSNYLEDRYSDEEGISLSDIKNKFKKKISINSSSDESDRERRLNKAKYNDDEMDSDKDVSFSDEDADSDGGKKAKTSKKKTKKVVSDEDDE